jgi:low temperature requirement protein LtrA
MADVGGIGRPWAVRMAGRDVGEQHRASTPLELLFDLTFVVAVGRLAAELARSTEAGQLAGHLSVYLMVFFAIWWAWVNFTWFASAFDTDDVGYRLLTLLQMAGVLVLAASVPAAFEQQEFTGVVVGYVIMRVALVAQWSRAARQDREHRRTALRYALGVLAVQLLWIGRLALPHGLALASFLILAAADMAVPWWAERTGVTSWHPQHIAERYGLFTLIVLGECVLAASNALQDAHDAHAAVLPLVAVGASALILLFALWWLYFLRDPAEGLGKLRNRTSFRWGYGHYGIFASLAALGAGIQVAASAVSRHLQAASLTVAAAVAVPVCVFEFLLWYLHEPLTERACPPLAAVLASMAATLGLAALAPALPLATVVSLLCLPSAALVVFSVVQLHRFPAA